MRREGALVVIALSSAAAPARADEAAMLDAPAIPAGRSISEQIADKLTLLGATIDAHLGPLTLDSIDLHIDGRHRSARLRLRGGGQHLSLDLDGHVRFEAGRARVAARLDLGVAGRTLHLQLPDFEMVPRTFGGEHYVELRLPLLEGTF